MADRNAPSSFKAFVAKTGAIFLSLTLLTGIFLFGIPLKWPESGQPDEETPAVVSTDAVAAEDRPTTPTLVGAIVP